MKNGINAWLNFDQFIPVVSVLGAATKCLDETEYHSRTKRESIEHSRTRDCEEEIMNKNCLPILTQIKCEPRRRLSAKPEIHDRTVPRTLNRMLFRVKLPRRVPADRNRPDLLNKRVDYANWVIDYAVGRHGVFVDECSYDIWKIQATEIWTLTFAMPVSCSTGWVIRSLGACRFVYRV